MMSKATLKGPLVYLVFFAISSVTIVSIYYTYDLFVDYTRHIRTEEEVKTKAAGIEYFHFVKERSTDLKNLSIHQEIQTYFINRILRESQTKEQDSTTEMVNSLFKKFGAMNRIRSEQRESIPIYQDLLLTDNNLNVLASSNTTSSFDSILGSISIKELAKHEYQLIESKTLVFTHPFYFKKKLRGYLISIIAPEAFRAKFLANEKYMYKIHDQSIANSETVQISRQTIPYLHAHAHSRANGSFELHNQLIFYSSLPGISSYVLRVIPTGKLGQEIMAFKRLVLAEAMLFIALIAGIIMFFVLKNKIEHRQDVMKSQLIQSSKLATIGTMAAGVAHEINNPLAVIRGYVDLLKKVDLGESGRLISVDKMEKSAVRIEKITSHLRTFGRDHKKADDLPINLLESIQDAFIFFGPVFKKLGIDYQIRSDPDEPIVLGNPINLESVFQNLLSNSKDAFENVSCEHKKSVSFHIEENGNDFAITYHDNAGGMNEDVEEKIFDPFFTTKEIGKGTGIGMSISHSCVKDMNGKITLNNSKGLGVTFVITLPKYA